MAHGCAGQRWVVRYRRNAEDEPLSRLDVHALLKSDRFGFERYGGRCEVLHRLNLSEEASKRLFTAVGCDVTAFLKVIDLNQLWRNLKRLFDDMEQRSIALHTMNVKSCAISPSENHAWLLTTSDRRVDDAQTRSLTEAVMQYVFPSHAKVGVSIMYGGGVRDILLADWCRAYNLTPTVWASPAFLIINAQPTDQTFLIPANCF